MDKKALVIVDNADISITYNNPDRLNRWSNVPNDITGLWYLNSQHHPMSGGNPKFGLSVDIVFEGHSLAMLGIGAVSTPVYPVSLIAITIDANTSHGLQIPAPKMVTSMTAQQFFQTPSLDEERHTIHFQNPDWEALDFLLIGVGPNTNLDGKVLWVDNEDPQIQYSGTSWRRNSALLDGSFPVYTTPAGNSTHQASTPGDLLSFIFYGSAVSVYGTYSWKNISRLSFVFTLDGTPHPRSFFVTDLMGDYVNKKSDGTNYLFFEAKNLTAGPHTLIVNLTRVENTTFRFDYLTYKPSFSTLATMPDLTLPPSSSSTVAAPSPTFAIAGTTDRGLPPGILGACVAGALLLLAALAVLAYYFLRRRKSRETKAIPFHSSHEADSPPAYRTKHLPRLNVADVPPIYAGPPATGDIKTDHSVGGSGSEADLRSPSNHTNTASYDMRRSS